LLTYQEKKQIESDIVKFVSTMLVKMEEPLKKSIIAELRKELKHDITAEVGPIVTAKVKESHKELAKMIRKTLERGLNDILAKLENQPNSLKKAKHYTV